MNSTKEIPYDEISGVPFTATRLIHSYRSESIGFVLAALMV
jgi:hypothetical protein